MGLTQVIKVAREGYKIGEASQKDLALDTNLLLPKIYGVVKRTTTGDVAHGLNYAPQFWGFWNLTTSPVPTYTHLAGLWDGVTMKVDNTNVHIDINDFFGPQEMYAVLFLDPLTEPTGTQRKERPNPALIVSDNITSDYDYQTRLHSGYDTLKVFKSGTLTITQSSESVAASGLKEYTTTFNHNLGYIPMWSPFIGYLTDLNQVYGGEDSTIPATVGLNNVEYTYPTPASWLTTSDFSEKVYFYMTSTGLAMKYSRVNYSGSPHTFVARTINLNYVIFYNRVDEEFNLLT